MNEINKAAQPPTSRSIFWLCMGFRRAASSTLLTNGAVPKQKHELLNNDTSNQDGGFWNASAFSSQAVPFSKKDWVLNPPSVIPEKPNSLDNHDYDSASLSDTDRDSVDSLRAQDIDETQIPTFSGSSEASAYNKARNGVERVLFQAKVPIYVNGDGPYSDLFLVLTSEAYYLLRIDSTFFHDFQPTPSISSQPRSKHLSTLSANAAGGLDTPNKNPFNRGFSFAPTGTKKPELVWRRPYRAIEKLSLGTYGLSMSISHRSSDLAPKVETLVAVCHSSSVAERMSAVLKQMCAEWRQFERTFAQEPSQLTIAKSVDDLFLQNAIESIIKRMEPGSVFPTCTFSSSVEYRDVLVSHVKLIESDGQKKPVLIIATKQHFAVLGFNFKYWVFSKDYNELRKKLYDLDDPATRDTAESTAIRESKLSKMKSEQVEKQRKTVFLTSKIYELGKLDCVTFASSAEHKPIMRIKLSEDSNAELRFLFYDFETSHRWKGCIGRTL